MNSFLQQILGQHNFHKCDEHLELWGGTEMNFSLFKNIIGRILNLAAKEG